MDSKRKSSIALAVSAVLYVACFTQKNGICSETVSAGPRTAQDCAEKQ
jgi:hypothetical protein